MSFEVRKIQRNPDGTYLISLPKNWVKRYNLDKASPLYIKERGDGCLILDPQYAVETTPEATINATSRLEDKILTSYLLGAEVITIEAPKLTQSEKRRIKGALNRLVGVEVMEEEPSRIVLQCLLKPSAFTPSQILRREYVLSSSMYKDAVKAFLGADVKLAESIPPRDEEVDRLYFLLVRLLRSIILNPRMSEKLNISLIDCLDYRLIASIIENIADQAAQLARHSTLLAVRRPPQTVVDLIATVGEKIAQIFDESMKAAFSKDEKLLVRAIGLRDETTPLMARLEATLTGLRSEATPPLLLFTSTLHRVFDYQKDIIDLITPTLP